MAEKKQNMAPVWKKLMKNVDSGEPTSFLDHVYQWLTQRERKPNGKVIEQYTKMFESRISAGTTAKLPGWEKPHAETSARSYDMKDVLKNALSDTVNWQTRKWRNFTKFQVPVWMIINSSKKKSKIAQKPTSVLDHVYLGCTQRQCEISKDIVDNYSAMFESRTSARGVEKLPFPQNLRISSWSYDVEGHAKKCVERDCELAIKTTQHLYKVSTPCIDDHRFCRGRNEICRKIITSMLSNCHEMLALGTSWTTWHSMVGQQAYKISHKMDSGM